MFVFIVLPLVLTVCERVGTTHDVITNVCTNMCKCYHVS